MLNAGVNILRVVSFSFDIVANNISLRNLAHLFRRSFEEKETKQRTTRILPLLSLAPLLVSLSLITTRSLLTHYSIELQWFASLVDVFRPSVSRERNVNRYPLANRRLLARDIIRRK